MKLESFKNRISMEKGMCRMSKIIKKIWRKYEKDFCDSVFVYFTNELFSK